MKRRSRVFISIGGMTCSACSGTIERALTSLDGVEVVKVSLLTEKAEVVFDGDALTADAIVEEIEDVGFEASLAGQPEVLDSQPQQRAAAVRRSRIFISVGGMTCSACSGTIERALTSLDGVEVVKVSLLTEKAEVVFNSDALTADAIVEEIEDVGFEASLAGQPEVLDSQPVVTDDHVPSVAVVQLCYYAHALSEQGIEQAKRSLMELRGVMRVDTAVVSNSDNTGQRNKRKQSRRKKKEKKRKAAGVAYSAVAADELDGFFDNESNNIHTNNNGHTDDIDEYLQFNVRYDGKLVGVRDMVAQLETIGIHIVRVRSDGDMKLRRQEMLQKRESEVHKWRSAFLEGLSLTIPVLLITMVCPFIPPLHNFLQQRLVRACTLRSVLLLLLATPVQFKTGRRFYVAAYKSVRHGSASMDVLIVMGSSAAYLYSIISLTFACTDAEWHGRVFFETSAMLITVVLLGRFLENLAKGRTSQALTVLMNLQPTTATLLHMNADDPEIVDREETTSVELVHFNDILKVERGATVPVDGVIIHGATSVDESLVTGEAMPVHKKVGDEVIGGTMNLDAPIRMRAVGVGSQTVLAQIVKLVEEAQTNKAPIQAFADRVARYFVPMVVSVSLLTFVVWYVLLKTGVAPVEWRDPNEDDFLFAFMNAVAVMVISCPCALGLATPTAVMVGTGVGAKFGILFKGGQPLETTGKTKFVLFDKTGTLTIGRASVDASETTVLLDDNGKRDNDDEVKSDGGADAHKRDEVELWSLIGSVEAMSEHLLAKAICLFAQTECSRLGGSMQMATQRKVADFHAETARGVRGRVDGEHDVVVGNRSWMGDNDIDVTARANELMMAIEKRGHIAVAAAVDGRIQAVVSISDPLKPESRMVVRRLQQQGIQVCMVTGDNHRTAECIGEKLGLPSSAIFAEVAPKDKADVVQHVRNRLSTGDGMVMFVGDGINDSPAIAAADIGMAVGGGTDVAVETASVVLMRSDLTDVLVALDLSRCTMNRIRWNFRFALVYNMIGIPLAAGVLYPLLHTMMPPALAAAAMGCSSLSVVLSSLRLNWYRPPKYLRRKLGGISGGAVSGGAGGWRSRSHSRSRSRSRSLQRLQFHDDGVELFHMPSLNDFDDDNGDNGDAGYGMPRPSRKFGRRSGYTELNSVVVVDDDDDIYD